MFKSVIKLKFTTRTLHTVKMCGATEEASDFENLLFITQMTPQ